MNMPMVSIIIPVYKVEAYLSRCLDSVIRQTYHNLEIILVDDGSPDNCGKICDKYAELDGRIKVVHKLNGGVSNARNTGLKNITSGKWVTWVDADDWIEPDIVEYLVKKALIYEADIAVCGYYMDYSDRQVPCSYVREEALESEHAIEKLLRNNIPWAMYSKLWRRDLFLEREFPEGRTAGEDLALAYQLFGAARRIVCLPEIKYHYMQRADSIMHEQSLRSLIDIRNVIQDCYEDAEKHWPQFRNLLEALCLSSATAIWLNYYRYSKKERDTYQPQIEEIAEFAKEHYRNCYSVRKYTEVGITGCAVLPLQAYAKWWSFAVAGFWGRLYRLKQKLTGV